MQMQTELPFSKHMSQSFLLQPLERASNSTSLKETLWDNDLLENLPEEYMTGRKWFDVTEDLHADSGQMFSFVSVETQADGLTSFGLTSF